jgi:phage tail-like protein
MRGLISDEDELLATPSPVRANVPGMFLDDELFLILCAAFDDLLAPLAVALDCLPAYLDPALAPEDFVPWLAALVGSAETRSAVAGAVAGYGRRGTADGLRRAAAQAAGVAVEDVQVDDASAVRWSATPGSPPPPPARAVTVRVPLIAGRDAAGVTAAVEQAVRASRPVHCPLRVDVTAS